MCKPTLTKKATNKTDLQSSSQNRGGRFGKMTVFFGCLFLVLGVFFPCLVSEIVGGWTKKYTSSVNFDTSKIPDLTGKVAIVTGANTGIGYNTALELARNGAEVIVAARNSSKGLAAVKKIEKETGRSDNLTFLNLDLSSLESVENFVTQFQNLNKPLHILILNAGLMKSPGEEFVGTKLTYGFETTRDGLETHIGVNHVAHFYLTKLLSKNLKKSAPSRVLSVSSMAEQGAYEEGFRFHEWMPVNGQMPEAYEDGKAYGQSKLANAMFANEISSTVFKDTGVTAYSLHPGVILTELGRDLEKEMQAQLNEKGFLMKSIMGAFGALFLLSNFNAADGALTQLHLATAPTAELVNGGFYHPIGKHVSLSHHQGLNQTLQKQVFEETERLIESLRGNDFNLKW